MVIANTLSPVKTLEMETRLHRVKGGTRYKENRGSGRSPDNSNGEGKKKSNQKQ